MAIAFVFLMGIANFALHRAVLDSKHAIVAAMRVGGGSFFAPRMTLSIEFAVLFAALLLVANGAPGWAWAYGAYTLANATLAWLILSDRM